MRTASILGAGIAVAIAANANLARAQCELHEDAKVIASDAGEDDRFGQNVAISGNFAVVGAHRNDGPAGVDQGAVYVFDVSDPDNPIQLGKLTASGTSFNTNLGQSVAIAGEVVVVGGGSQSGSVGQGSAYVFVKPLGGWADMTETGRLVASDGATVDEFGFATAISGDTVVVGARKDDHDGVIDAGSVYVFVKPVAGWSGEVLQSAKLTASDGAGGEALGQSVGINRGIAIVGAPEDNGLAGLRQGAAYVFNPLVPDCNGNGIPDECDIADCLVGDVSCQDCNLNEVPDGCEGGPFGMCPNDCSGNGFCNCVVCICDPGWDDPDCFDPICGDGMILGLEECDDNNTGDGDGCSSTCIIEPDCACGGAPSVCTCCGDGAVEGAEACDDGFTDTCGTCNTDCTGPGSGSVCGDAVVCDETEACDDGNTNNGDCCSSVCQPEPPGGPCDDGDFCTDPDVCVDNVCQGPLLPECIPCVVACMCNVAHGESHCFLANEAGCLETGDGMLEVCIEGIDLDMQACLSVGSVEIGDPEVDVTIGSAPGLGVALGRYDLSPDGQAFAPGQSVSLTIRQDISGLNQNQRDRLDLFWLDEPGNPVASLDANCCPVADEALCSVEVDHFSTYSFIAAADSDDDGVPDLWPPEEDNCPDHYNPGQEDCDGDGIGDVCAIATRLAEDNDNNGIPDSCQVAPLVPAPAPHDARKHRYLSVDTTTNPAKEVVLKVELTSMRRCSTQPSRACTVDGDCEAAVPDSGTCIEHADVGTAGPWWVQTPQQEELGCIPGPCGDEDWFARVDADLHAQVWDLTTLHIGDCEVIPVATYEARACLAPDGIVCSDPLTIGTIEQPFIAPGFRGNYGDVVGPVEGTDPDLYFTPPDGFTNVLDVSAYILTSQNYGTANKPQTHPTWVDLHGLGDGNPPQYILNVSDLGQILKAFAGDAWTDDPGNMTPGQCQ